MATTKMNVQSFIDAIKGIGFYDEHFHSNTYEVRNRSVSPDDDCSDNPRDDSFYERYEEKYSKWATRKMEQVNAIAKTYGVKITFKESPSYGILQVVIP